MEGENKKFPPPGPSLAHQTRGKVSESTMSTSQTGKSEGRSENNMSPFGGGSRGRILSSIQFHKPAPIDLPFDMELDTTVMDPQDRFAFHLDNIGGVARFFDTKTEAIASLPESVNGMQVRNLITGGDSLPDDTEPDVTIIEARYAVAENGAVFVTDEEVPERNMLFLGHKLIALLPAENLLADMHEAYGKIDLSSVGFGIFIAGPSATADIAQILVRGAHGPSEMEVYLFDQ